MAGSEYGNNHGNNHGNREPVQYNIKMVDHLDSREILEALRDPGVQPAEDIVRQAGRRGIWKRSWEKLAMLEGRPSPLEDGPSSINEGRPHTGQYDESHTRAMNFALDLSRKTSVEAQKDFLEIQQALHPERAPARWEDLKRRAPDAFGKDWDPAEMAARKESERPQFSTPEIIDTMGEDFARRTEDAREHRSLIQDFQSMRPDDWQKKLTALAQVEQDTLDAGRHLAYQALMDQDPQALDRARETMANAISSFRVNLETGVLDDSIINFIPEQHPVGKDHDQNAYERTAYVFQMAALLEHRTGFPDQEAREFLAEATVARDLSAIRYGCRFGLDQSQNPELQEAIHDISDKIFQHDLGRLRSGLTETMAEGDLQQTAQQYGLIQQAADQLQAVASASQQDPEKLGWNLKEATGQKSEELTELLTQMFRNGSQEVYQYLHDTVMALPEHQDGLQKIMTERAEFHIMQAAISFRESPGNPQQAGEPEHVKDGYQHFRRGVMLGELSQPGRVEACLAYAQDE